MNFKWKDERNGYLYLLDGDQWTLLPGREFTCTVEALRVKLHRACKKRGLKYRSQMYEGHLWFQAYREVPGDMEPTD